jgi:hypothetical protein
MEVEEEISLMKPLQVFVDHLKWKLILLGSIQRKRDKKIIVGKKKEWGKTSRRRRTMGFPKI